MMNCRHGLDFNFAAFVTNGSEATIGHISWLVWYLDMVSDLILDAIEFKFQFTSNFDLGLLMFSHYKNTTNGKALIDISPQYGIIHKVCTLKM